MFMKDDKKAPSIIVAKIKKKGESEMVDAPKKDGDVMADSDELMIAAEEIMDAVHKKDSRALRDALKSAFDIAGSMSDDSAEEESEASSEEC